MNYDVMEPGIEIDAIVARNIFGWTQEKTDENKWFDPFVKLWRPYPKANPATPGWSRSPFDAMDVITQMAEDGWALDASFSNGSWETTFNGGDTHGVHDTFAMAICRSALKAVGA